MLHRTGNRVRHIKKEIFKPNEIFQRNEIFKRDESNSATLELPSSSTSESTSKGSSLSGETLVDFPQSKVIVSSGSSTFGDWVIDRSKHIPMRLDLTERKLLRL